MRGFITCKHCKGVGRIYKCLIIPIECKCCNGRGYIWAENIYEYYENLEKSEKSNVINKVNKINSESFSQKWKSFWK